jgi:hypothetical protein
MPDDPALRAAWILAVQEQAGPAFAWRTDDATLSAETPSARFALQAGALRVGASDDSDWLLSLRTEALGRAGAMRPWSATPTPSRERAHEARASHDGVVERWIHGPLGVEHLFEVAERPAGDGALTIVLATEGLRPVAQGSRGVAFVDADDVALVRYAELFAHDADRRALAARMELDGTRVRLVIDDTDARYPLVIDPITWVDTVLAPSDGASGDEFGRAVAISADGNTALIGAAGDDFGSVVDAGTARVFVRSAGTWTPQATLQAPDAASLDELGESVALTLDGNLAFVGAPGDNSGRGSVRVFSRTGTTWTSIATLTAADAATNDFFGSAVACSSDGSTVAVGVPFDDVVTPVAVSNGGSVRIWTRTGPTTWAEQATLVDSGAAANDFGGNAVALSGDGNAVVVGIPGDDISPSDGVGSFRVWDRSGTTWTRGFGWAGTITGGQAGLSVTISRDGNRVTASQIPYVFQRSGASFVDLGDLGMSGSTVALRADGNRLIMRLSSAQVWVFDWLGGRWRQQGIITAPGFDSEDLGRSLCAISEDGSVALIGTMADVVDGVRSGSARVFTITTTLFDGEACTSGAQCGSGLCVDGVCCNNACGGGAADCQACSIAAGGSADGTCGPLRSAVASATVCRAAAGVCDAADTCSPTSTACPVDQKQIGGTPCRPSAGVCDVQEVCNGTSNTCPPDQLQPAGLSCRGPSGVCDAPEVCNGTSAVCPPDVLHAAGVECRASVGACDVAEACTGTSNACPPDAAATPGTTCGPAPISVCDLPDQCSGTVGATAVCVPRVNVAGTPCRASAGTCDVAEACDGASPSCPADARVAVGTTCRAATGVCDAAEVCDGSAACPPDARVAAGTPCRAATGVCDVAEACDGSAAACPPDGLAPATTTCRAAIGACDATETCTGSSAACPADAAQPAGTACGGAPSGVCDAQDACVGTVGATATCEARFASPSTTCRAAAGPCDAAETCTGSSTTCPSDAFAGSSVTCRPAVSACDAAETCNGTSIACPADAARPEGSTCGPTPTAECDAPDVCAGTVGATASCQTRFATSDTVCRPASGACDVAETCTGSSFFCPRDDFALFGIPCREPRNECDARERCTGTSAACPPDLAQAPGTPCGVPPTVFDPCQAQDVCAGSDGPSARCEPRFAPAGVECRPSTSACDVAEACTGASDSCPADGFAPSTTVCRASAGECDVPESCTGTSAACPTDAFAPSTVVCRPSVGECDAPDACTGTRAACPTDAAQPEGTACGGAPSGACDAQDACVGSVGASATCAPRVAAAGTACRSASCTGGVATQAASCTGADTSCPEPVTELCAPFLCGATECATSCTSDADCAPGILCIAGVCRGTLENGAACTRDEACSSGQCVDGVCCNAACDGQCEACDVVGRVGECVPVIGSPRGDRAACDPGTALGCGGFCNGTNRTACAFRTGGLCRAQGCVDGAEALGGACDGAGGCAPTSMRPCAPYGCAEFGCHTSCVTDAECAAGARCMGSECVLDTDAGVGVDAGTPVDAGTLERDAGSMRRDAGSTPRDAGTMPSDAGARDAEVSLDGSNEVDAGLPPSMAGGCGCVVPTAASPLRGPHLLVLLGVLAALVVRRRR